MSLFFGRFIEWLKAQSFPLIKERGVLIDTPPPNPEDWIEIRADMPFNWHGPRTAVRAMVRAPPHSMEEPPGATKVIPESSMCDPVTGVASIEATLLSFLVDFEDRTHCVASRLQKEERCILPLVQEFPELVDNFFHGGDRLNMSRGTSTEIARIREFLASEPHPHSKRVWVMTPDKAFDAFWASQSTDVIYRLEMADKLLCPLLSLTIEMVDDTAMQQMMAVMNGFNLASSDDKFTKAVNSARSMAWELLGDPVNPSYRKRRRWFDDYATDSEVDLVGNESK